MRRGLGRERGPEGGTWVGACNGIVAVVSVLAVSCVFWSGGVSPNSRCKWVFWTSEHGQIPTVLQFHLHISHA